MFAPTESRRRSAPLAGILLLFCCGAFVVPQVVPQTVRAQDEAEEDAANDKQFDQDAGEAPKAKETQKPKTLLWWVIVTSGWIGAVILGLSLYFIATVTRLFMELRLEVALPPELVEECKTLLERRDYKAIYAALKEDDSFFSRVVTAGMAELSIGLPEARDAMERVAEVETVEMDRKISMLAVLGTLGPMIGLLGTLQGMIRSFSVIALSGTQLRAEEVAGGISEALLLTFEGVALSVPAIYFFAVFRNRVASISAAAVLAADEFIRRLMNATRTKPAATPQVATASPGSPPPPPPPPPVRRPGAPGE